MSKTRAAKAISLLWIGSLLGAGFAFLTQIVLARRLGATDFGIFSSALAAVTLLAPLAGFGVAPFWLKAFGEEGWGARRWWKGSFRFIGVSTALVILALAVWGLWGPHDDRMSQVVLLLLLYVLGQLSLELVGSRFQLEERYLALALWQLLPHFARLIIVVIVCFGFSLVFELYDAALIYSIVSVVFFLSGLYLLLRMCHGDFQLKGHGEPASAAALDSPEVMRVGQESWPFGTAGVFYLLYFQSAVILLNYLSGAESAGIYNVAFVIMSAVYLFPSVVYQKFLLPKIHRWANSDHALLAEAYSRGNLSMLVLGVMAMLIIWLCSSWSIPLLFGEEFDGAVLVLNVLAVAAPIRFVATSVGAVLVTRDNMRRKVVCMGAVAVFNLGVNSVLIPIYGVLGAAVTTIFSDSLLLILYLFSARKYVFKEVGS